jgi:poly-gamma-glutamate synthesis protein (capsule biosynthesis protein)
MSIGAIMKIKLAKIRTRILWEILLIIGLSLLLTGCNRIEKNPSLDLTDAAGQITDAVTPTSLPTVALPQSSPSPSSEPPLTEAYDFINDTGTDLESRINPPGGYTRVTSTEGELADFLRKHPLKSSDSQLLLYNGEPKSNQDNYAALFELSLGDRDLQQCADSILRIYAEYYWSLGAYDKIAFHLTNGFYMEYTKWRVGNRLQVEGNKVSWVKTASYDDSYEEFLNYLTMVFAYAGTLSLAAECDPISTSELLPGDLFLKGGSPGHCILIVDMAVDTEGNKCYLLAQGYMPAQDFHVLKNPLHPEDPWYYAEEMGFPLDTPEWQFSDPAAVRWDAFPFEGAQNLMANTFPEEDSLPAWSPSGTDKEHDSSVTLLAVGDNLIHIEVVQSGKQEDGRLNYDHLYSNLKEEITAADIAVVNQETILGGEDFVYSGYPNFNSPTEIGDALVNAGFDVVLQATNHTMDMGLKGIENTLSYWKTKPEVTVLGVNETEEASKEVTIVEKNGIKLALLNYSYSLNGYTLPKDKPYLVNMLDKKKMAEDIAKAEALADFTIIFPHWGSEYIYEATKMQKDLTQFYYEQGVDLVIGAHPHVIEPVEWIETDGNHRMLVYYSLGNFMSYQKESPRMLGAMAGITITKDALGTYISEANITPIVTHYENGPADFNYGLYKLADYTPELAKVHGVSDIAKYGAMDYQTTYDLAKKVLGSWFQDK